VLPEGRKLPKSIKGRAERSVENGSLTRSDLGFDQIVSSADGKHVDTGTIIKTIRRQL